jgi:polyisoprenoid-binding protein YceI
LLRIDQGSTKEFAMRYLFAALAAAFLFSGCEAQPVPGPAAPTPVAGSATATGSGDAAADAAGEPAAGDPAATDSTGSSAADAGAPAGEESGTAAAKAPVPVVDGIATLSPDNTKIQFVGLHSPPKDPEPRTGGFAKFSGQAKLAGQRLESISVDIDTTSLFTSIGKLTDHLKSGDFFEVNEYPTAKFESTKITPSGSGASQIEGNLTLHGVTKEISFPATVSVSGAGLRLSSEFKIDRTQFGMTFGEGQVEKDVTMNVVIGEQTVPQ